MMKSNILSEGENPQTIDLKLYFGKTVCLKVKMSPLYFH